MTEFIAQRAHRGACGDRQFVAIADSLSQCHQPGADTIPLGFPVLNDIAGFQQSLEVAMDAALGRPEGARQFGDADGALLLRHEFEHPEREDHCLHAVAFCLT